MPLTGDPRLDDLIELYENVADQLATEFTSLSLEKEDDNRKAIYAVILAILTELRNATEAERPLPSIISIQLLRW